MPTPRNVNRRPVTVQGAGDRITRQSVIGNLEKISSTLLQCEVLVMGNDPGTVLLRPPQLMHVHNPAGFLVDGTNFQDNVSEITWQTDGNLRIKTALAMPATGDLVLTLAPGLEILSRPVGILNAGGILRLSQTLLSTILGNLYVQSNDTIGGSIFLMSGPGSESLVTPAQTLTFVNPAGVHVIEGSTTFDVSQMIWTQGGAVEINIDGQFSGGQQMEVRVGQGLLEFESNMPYHFAGCLAIWTEYPET